MSEVVFVGTSDAFGAGGRRQSAVLVRGASGGTLLDCGATTTVGLCELGIDRAEIDAVLVSHFHGDHFAGIPILLMAALYEDDRRSPIRIAGPPGIERRVRTLAAAMGYAIEERSWTFPIHFQEFAVGRSCEVGPVRVGAFEAHHQAHTHPHGLAVDTGAERIVYSGDTGWFPELPSRVGEADLFICECTYHTHDFEYHLSHQELVARKHEFHCNRMILTHLGEEMSDRRGRADFETADDGLVVNL
jgi:ribonuclease BN (tRNA processing enzyme)